MSKYKYKSRIVCVCGGYYQELNRWYHVRTKMHKNYEAGIIDIKNNNKNIIFCECGGHYKKEHKTSHFKTLKHKKYIKKSLQIIIYI
jgi:hypothetical protein